MAPPITQQHETDINSDKPLFTRDLLTSTKTISKAFDTSHDKILEKCIAMNDMDTKFFNDHFKPLQNTKNNGNTIDCYQTSLAGFLVLANMMDDPKFYDYLQEIQAVCIDLDIILRGPINGVRELAWSVPLEDMAETIKANLAPLLGATLTDRDQRRRDFAFALIDRLNPDVEIEPMKQM